MKSLNDLKRERKSLIEVIELYEELMKLKSLNEEEEIQYKKAKNKLIDINKTIDNLTVEIKYTNEELAVFELPIEEQEDAWFNLLKNCNFSKDEIIRIGSMLCTDGLFPVFKKDGIKISQYTANKAYELLCDNNFKSLSEITLNKLFEVKNKVNNKETLTKEELIYKNFLDIYDNYEEEGISGKCSMVVYNYFLSILHKKEDKSDYLVDRICLALSYKGILASGEKEIIAIYFRDKKE